MTRKGRGNPIRIKRVQPRQIVKVNWESPRRPVNQRTHRRAVPTSGITEQNHLGGPGNQQHFFPNPSGASQWPQQESTPAQEAQEESRPKSRPPIPSFATLCDIPFRLANTPCCTNTSSPNPKCSRNGHRQSIPCIESWTVNPKIRFAAVVARR